MNKDLKIWGGLCCTSVVVILTPLWTTLFAIILKSSLPGLIDFMTRADKFISIIGVLIFIIAVNRFSKAVAKSHLKVETVQQ